MHAERLLPSTVCLTTGVASTSLTAWTDRPHTNSQTQLITSATAIMGTKMPHR